MARKAPLQIKLKPVESSAIAEIGHHPKSGTVRIKFASGHVGDFASFPAEKFAEFSKADSLGKYFHQQIRGKHEHTRVV